MAIYFYDYGSDIIAVQTCMPGAGSLMVGCGSTQIEAIDNLSSTPFGGHEGVTNGLRWFLDESHDSETDVDDLDEIDAEGKDDVKDWNTVETFVCTYPGDERDGACDVEVQIGRSGGGWYLRSKDDAGGSDDCDDTAYDTEDEAREAAEEFAEANNEAETGEDAEKYLARQLEEEAGESSDDGEYCVYYDTATEGSGPGKRYETLEQAKAAAEISNNRLHAANPGGNLLCGYEVRQLVDNKWVRVED